MALPSFPSTRWTLVLATSDPAQRSRALQELLQAYWMPIYLYLRRRGQSPEDAEELVQELFVELVEGSLMASADPARGRLRGFLKACADQQLLRRRERAGAWKRGGRVRHVPLDAELAERLLADSPQDAEAACDRAWARLAMERALTALIEGSPDRAALLREFFGSGTAPSLEDAATRHGMSVAAVKSALHRARHRYRAILLREVADTVHDPEQAASELRALLAAA